MSLKSEEAMLDINPQEMFDFYKTNFELGLIKRPEHIAVYTKPVVPRTIIDGSELQFPFYSEVIIGPNDGCLATWIEPKSFMKGANSAQYGELSRIYPGHMPGVMQLELTLKYQTRGPHSVVLTEKRSIHVHSDSKTLPRDLEYKLFDFKIIYS